MCGAEVNVTDKCVHATCICGYAVVRESVAKHNGGVSWIKPLCQLHYAYCAVF